MQRISKQITLLLTALICATAARAALETEKLDSDVEVVISVADQRMVVLCDGELVDRFPISTSRFGIGDNLGSFRTPLGKLKVCDKIGEGLPAGAVIHHRAATGEVLSVNAPGRDPIVSRIL
ncbi:MAG TPA: L,D-transpeptidase, partial [Chthoniobacteraceae bacterium]